MWRPAPPCTPSGWRPNWKLEDSRVQLERSHGRLLHAREEERRRLRRDLHDGLGPLLAGMTLQVDAARNLLHRKPTGTDKLLGTIRDESVAQRAAAAVPITTASRPA